jgi:bacterioferritin-associated ferredoxin
MAPAFVFAEDIAKALRDGKKELVVPEDARISAAALDLIKEKNIRIIYGSGRDEKAGTDTDAGRKISKETQTVKETVAQPERDVSAAQEGPLSEEDVDRIVNRVINRFRELKGEQPVETARSGAAPEDDDDLVICRCEEITKGEIKEAIRNGMRTLNGIKRITRAGMGLCQGQTCQRLVTQILASELGVPAGEVTPTTARAPVRPLKLSVFATS